MHAHKYIYKLYILYIYKVTTCTIFISNTFISNARLKLAKSQAKSKQHRQAELLLFENYLLSLSMLSPKYNGRYCKKCTKNEYGC